MDDFKEKNNGEDLDETGALNELTNEEILKKEMEELAKTFQEEFDNAKEQSAENQDEVFIQQLEEITEDNKTADENSEIPEDELCECCGEKRRGTAANPNSPYCDECDAGLRVYPFGWKNLIFLFAILAFSIFSCYTFSTHMEVYVASANAHQMVNEKKLISGLNAYRDVANKMINENINAELVFKREIMLAYDLGYIEDISDATSTIKSWELNLPHFNKVKKVLIESENLLATATAANTILQPYRTAKASDIPYDELLAKFDSLMGQPIVEEETTTAADETQKDDKSQYDRSEIKPTSYNSAMVSFYKYYLAFICDKDVATQISFLEEIKNKNPEYVWIYGATLGDLYAKAGKDVTEICKILKEYNAEDVSATVVEVTALRVKGDYDAALKTCDEQITQGGDNIYEFYRQKALILLSKGDYTAAYDSAYKAYEENSYLIPVCDTLALASVAAEKIDTYTEIEKLLTGSDLDVSTEVKDFKDGKIKLEDILLKGDFDVQ